MARPLHTAQLKPQMPAGRGAAAVLTVQIADIRAHVPTALVGDVEGIHDLRVAVKRLRESMRLFRKLLPGRRRRLMMPAVELLNDTLGAVRERDVMMLDARELAAEVDDDGGLCEAAITQWRLERSAAFEQLLKGWARLTSDDFLPALEELARRTARRKRRLNRLPLERFVLNAVTRALERVHDRLDPALHSTDAAPMHRLRIAVKRLRYSMEPFRRTFPGLKGPTRLAGSAQEALGLTHDIDVLQQALVAHIGEIEPAHREAAESLLARLWQHREQRAARARQIITQLADPEFRRVVLDAID